MRACLRLILTLTAVVALTTACTPFGSTSSRNRLPEDSRFAEFTYKTDGEIKVQERTDSFNERMPALGATAGHVAAANFPEGRSSLPSPDHHFWVTGVATVAPESIQKLSAGATGNNTLLPGIYPGLYQYVPRTATSSPSPPTTQTPSSRQKRTISTRTGGRSRSPTLRPPRTATSSSSPARASPASARTRPDASLALPRRVPKGRATPPRTQPGPRP